MPSGEPNSLVAAESVLRGGGVVVVGLDLELAFGFLGHQVGAHEGIEVAVEDAVDVADDELGAMVFDLAIRLHDV